MIGFATKAMKAIRSYGRWLGAVLWLVAWSPGADAHALAPSLLSLEPLNSGAASAGRYQVIWKTPLQRVAGSELRPVLPAACEALSKPVPTVEGTGLTTRWTIDCGATGIVGKTLAVEGIAASRADVLVRINHGGRSFQQILTGSEPAFTVPQRQSALGVFGQYVELGVEHLLLGIDHVLFVIALVLLVPGRVALIKTITSFTLGHSVTLSAAVLGYVRFPQSLAEVLIAFSIVIAFAGVLRSEPDSRLRRSSWVMALGFGLLHGLGFAGALSEAGLPAADIPLALVAFNVGIELGQLLLIALLLFSATVLQRVLPWLHAWRAVPIYAVGTLAGLWFWQRLFGVLG